MSIVQAKDEAAILSRAFAHENATLSVAAAQSILAIELSEFDRQESKRLAELAQQGMLSPTDKAELDAYRHVGRLIELMKSKARISLKAHRTDA